MSAAAAANTLMREAIIVAAMSDFHLNVRKGFDIDGIILSSGNESALEVTVLLDDKPNV